ncbi:hypothetical protein FHS01_004845 [Longimicrobium terrae]|uniref:Uncharacterized protein n=1 Tax=Longimicrobium terrae TaxID=1639882 RepID=A0A841H4H0_9BACT|nr:hypothetical protein [Longimicrobium terrae]MBB6073021.1 hypothetical protein [Longimicrobium terrae]
MMALWIWSMVAALLGAGMIRCGERAPKPAPVRVRARNGR